MPREVCLCEHQNEYNTEPCLIELHGMDVYAELALTGKEFQLNIGDSVHNLPYCQILEINYCPMCGKKLQQEAKS